MGEKRTKKTKKLNRIELNDIQQIQLSGITEELFPIFMVCTFISEQKDTCLRAHIFVQ